VIYVSLSHFIFLFPPNWQLNFLIPLKKKGKEKYTIKKKKIETRKKEMPLLMAALLTR
jgi:hypothetical protein